MNSKVSVVVTTKNEEKNIENCLKSILAQSYSNLEIIVVDNSSSDKTKELAQKYTKQVFDKGPERSTQRNFGMIQKSSGKYVMFVDADMILAPKLVESAIATLQKGMYSALFIPEIVLGKKFWSRVRRFERTFYDGSVIDGARFFEKEVFEKIGGFDESLYACEDWDLDKRLKRAGVIGLLSTTTGSVKSWPLGKFIQERGVNPLKYPAVVFHNESEFDLKKYLSKKGYYSQNFDVYQQKWAGDPDIKKQFGLGYRFFGVFVEKGKWLKLLGQPVLTLGMYYLRFQVGWQFLKNKLSRNQADS